MPGKEVKNWAVYEALRREGKSKASSARIANAQATAQSAEAKKPAPKKR